MNNEKLIGIDEAGWGAVIGPFVVAGIKINKIERLEKIGVKDSKKLKKEEREKIYEKILTIPRLQICYKIVPVEDINKNKKMDLWYNSVKKILEELNYKDTKKIFIPQIGQTSKATVSKHIDLDEFIYEKDADEKFIEVATASIIAKVIRDRKWYKIVKEIGEGDFRHGGGYANSDTYRACLSYIKKYKKLPPQLRHTKFKLELEKELIRF